MTLTLTLASEADTRRLACDLASLLMPGDVVAVSGDLGSGKSFLIRAMLRHLAHDPALEVPSPSFTLVQGYATPRLFLNHADFYRLGGPEEVEELGLFDDPAAVSLIEWPERAREALPGARLDISLAVISAEAREVELRAHGTDWQTRLARLAARRAFLARAGWERARRIPMQGDCSTRIYTRLELEGGDKAILMDAPRKADPGLGAASYSAVAHLAEDAVPFVAVDEALRAHGFSAPRILAADLDEGLLLLEDLGGEGILDEAGRPLPARYHAAAEMLTVLHRLDWPGELSVPQGGTYRLPVYDVEAMLAEVGLFLDWYLPHMGREPDAGARASYLELWRTLAEDLQVLPQTLVLRDFHSPNILWLGAREGHARVGLIDFQDAVLGPEAYDLASLAQDARVAVDRSLEEALLNAYLEARAGEAAFNPLAFLKAYRVMGAQRASKVLGIFARLARRDGKAQHLDKLPIVRDYLMRNLEHPALFDLAAWHAAHAPLAEPA